jgi:hypothetical protein
MKYYDVSAGFFPVPIKLCFNNKAFFDVLRDYQITPPEDPKPLDMGIGETHCFNNQKEMVIIVVLNLDAMNNHTPTLVGVIAHECSHVIERILEGVGEEVEDFGEETRAYLLEHLVEQVFTASVLELTKNAKRKEARAKARAKNQGARGAMPQVEQPGANGGPGPFGNPPGTNDSGGSQGQQG